MKARIGTGKVSLDKSTGRRGSGQTMFCREDSSGAGPGQMFEGYSHGDFQFSRRQRCCRWGSGYQIGARPEQWAELRHNDPQPTAKPIAYDGAAHRPADGISHFRRVVGSASNEG